MLVQCANVSKRVMVASTSRFMHSVITCVKSIISASVKSNSFVWCIASLCGEHSNNFRSSWRRRNIIRSVVFANVLYGLMMDLNPIEFNDIEYYHIFIQCFIYQQ
eukprot:87955_1